MDYQIQELKKKLIEEANISELPATVLYYIFKEVAEMAYQLAAANCMKVQDVSVMSSANQETNTEEADAG